MPAWQARPSGTEPKLKVYLCVSGADKAQAQLTEEELVAAMDAVVA